MDDVVLNKAAIIERCVRRIRQEYVGKENVWKGNFTVQDSIILNLQRTCEAAIDLANFIVKKRKLGIPQNSRDSFDFLTQAGIIHEPLSVKMKHMVGFRNLAVHEYQTLNLDIVESIILHGLKDFEEYSQLMIIAEKS